MENSNAFIVSACEERKVVVVEHPGFVTHIDRALDSLGGANAVSSFLRSEDPQKHLNLFLNRQDPFRRPIPSRLRPTNDVILKISVPKRTGRKRKRESLDSFEPTDTHLSFQSSSQHDSSKCLLRSIRDNPGQISVQALGVTEESHRFRSLPDFQFSLAGSPLADSLKSCVLPFQYDKLKQFKFDTQSRGVKPGMDMIPPPAFSQLHIPFHYSYLQNPAVATTIDEAGKETTTNISVPPSTRNATATLEDAELPQAPPSDLPPIETLDEHLQEAIRQLGEIMKDRPIVTRRYVANKFGHKLLPELRHAVKYHAYIFRAGPWRDCFVKYGIDPRTDSKYRIYQALMFQIPIKDTTGTWEDGRVKWSRSHPVSRASNPESHIFDGTSVIPDGKLWQACDITDPLLRRILDEDGPSDTFNAVQDGWYQNGTWAKVRAIMKDKITLLLAGVQPSDAEYQKYLSIPSTIRRTPEPQAHGEVESKQRDGPLAAEIRSLARQSLGKLQDRKRKEAASKPRNRKRERDDLDEADNG